MFDALRHDKHFASVQRDVAVAHLDGDPAFEDQEEVVGFVVLVPDERPLHLHHHEVVTVELADRSRLEVLCEQGKLVCEVDAVHDSVPLQGGVFEPQE